MHRAPYARHRTNRKNFCCHELGKDYACGSCVEVNLTEPLNTEYCRKALEKVGNPNLLVNIVSRRVRQLNSGGGAGSRPLVAGAEHLGAADIALLEVIEGKVGHTVLPELSGDQVAKKRRRG